MPQIFIRHNFSRIAIALEGVSGKSLQKAVARSIKRVTKGVAKLASQEIRSRRLLNMKAGALKKRIRVFDHTGSGKSVGEQYGEVHLSGRPENLAYFYARRVSAGRSAVVQGQNKFGAWQGVKLYKILVSEQGRPYLEQDRAFLLVRGAGAQKIILTREQGSKRLPVRKTTGPSVGKLASDAGLLPTLQAQAEARYEREFETNLAFYAEQAIERAKSR